MLSLSWSNCRKFLSYNIFWRYFDLCGSKHIPLVSSGYILEEFIMSFFFGEVCFLSAGFCIACLNFSLHVRNCTYRVLSCDGQKFKSCVLNSPSKIITCAFKKLVK